MRKLLQKTKLILVAAGLLVGANAWADAGDVTTQADINFSNEIKDGVVAGTANSMTVGSNSEIKDGVLWLGHNQENVVTIDEQNRAGYGHSDVRDVVTVTFSLGIGNAKGLYGAFYLKDADGKNIAYLRYGPWEGGSESNLGLTLDGNLFFKSNAVDWASKTDFTVVLDYKNKTISTTAYNNKTKNTFTSSVSMTNANAVASFVVASNSGNGGDARRSLFDDLKIVTTEGNYEEALANYRISWKNGEEEIKYEIRTGNPNGQISLNSDDAQNFFIDTKKYIYLDNNLSENNVISSDGSTVVTITVREAATWNYTVNAVDEENNVLSQITEGNVVEGEAVYYYYPVFQLVGTSLLRADINDKSYGRGATPTEDNSVFNVVYKATDINDIVFYKEAEEIEGMTSNNSGNVPARCSNGFGAFATAATTIATLAPGKYKLSGFAWGNSGTDFKFSANGEDVATLTTVSSTVGVTTSDEFELTGTSALVMSAQGNGGSSPKVLDFIYIQNTGEAALPANATATLGANGYSTFASVYDLDLSGLNDAKAYTATLNGAELSFAACTDKVVAGTGLLLKGTAGAEVTIPVIANGAAAVDGNSLTGVTTATSLQSDADGNYIFVMKKAVDANDALTFLPLSTSSAVEIPAGKAYVSVPASAFAGGTSRALVVAFGDDTTGINSISTPMQQEDTYNLNGQRVENPAKGLYIVNGKKIIFNK